MVADYPQQPGVIAQVAPGQTVLLLHADQLIDVPAERARLQKEMGKVEKDLTGLRTRLGNADFLQRAKPDVVERDRARVQELESRMSELQQHLSALPGA